MTNRSRLIIVSALNVLLGMALGWGFAGPFAEWMGNAPSHSPGLWILGGGLFGIPLAYMYVRENSK